MQRLMQRILTVVIVFACGTAGWAAPPPPRSIVLFVGGGMGEAQRQAARVFRGLPGATPQGPGGTGGPVGADARLVMDGLRMRGAADVRSASALVPDASAAATAIATGVRVPNQTLSMGADGRPLPTVLERARKSGLSTGLISTLPITSATAAAFASHFAGRRAEYDVAVQYLGAGVQVLLGGGELFFRPRGSGGGGRADGRDLAEELRGKGYAVVTDRDGLLADRGSARLLGLFDAGAMDYAVDRNAARQPSLAEMTRVGLQSLARNPKGFFLAVHAGHIDWACHDGDLAAVIHDVLALDEAVAEALAFQKSHPGTLVLVANPHETGGLTLPAGFDLTPLTAVRASVEKTVGSLDVKNLDPNAAVFEDTVRTRLGLTLDVPAREKLKLAQRNPRKIMRILTDLQTAATRVHFSTAGHTGEPAVICAQGPGQELFAGFYGLTDLCGKMLRVLKLTPPAK